jgi:hypothetical protein
MLWNIRRPATLADRTLAISATLAAAALDTTLEEGHMDVPAIRRLTVSEQSPDIECRRTRLALERSRPGSRRFASTREVCGGEELSVRLASHWEGRSHCPVVRVKEEERCLQEECELQNFRQQQSDG